MKGDLEPMTEGTTEALEQMLIGRVDVDALADEKDREKINSVVFELYKEAASLVNLVAHILDEDASTKGGWPRNQAVCGGLMVRIVKFMVVVTQLSAEPNRAEVVNALNRSIMESSINLEFLAVKDDDRYFDQFVKSSLGPERELYDLIQQNITARQGETWPIEQRMLDSINDVCRASGVRIEDVDRRYGDWGDGLRERLKALKKEERYVAMVRTPSHAVHGTWVDLYKNHLECDSTYKVFKPDPRFASVDARALGPVATIVLEASRPYLQRFFAGIPETSFLLDRIDDLRARLRHADEIHEQLLNQQINTSGRT